MNVDLTWKQLWLIDIEKFFKPCWNDVDITLLTSRPFCDQNTLERRVPSEMLLRLRYNYTQRYISCCTFPTKGDLKNSWPIFSRLKKIWSLQIKYRTFSVPMGVDSTPRIYLAGFHVRWIWWFTRILISTEPHKFSNFRKNVLKNGHFEFQAFATQDVSKDK